uniref:hypothetical protein n=1 Tax=Cupriavidus taiwanensis TaxID=164546 RepID=UPI003F492404
MKKILGLVGIAAACGVCCTFPLALPLLGGLAASGLGFTLGWEIGALLAVAAVATFVMLARRRKLKSVACAPLDSGAAGCGCAPGCATGKGSAS